MPPTAEPPMVRFREVTKRYADLVVLDQLDLDIAANAKVAIIGHSLLHLRDQFLGPAVAAQTVELSRKTCDDGQEVLDQLLLQGLAVLHPIHQMDLHAERSEILS